MNDSSQSQALPTLAIFDFDDTLTKRDSLFPFLQMAVGKLRFGWGLLILSPILVGYTLCLVPNWRAKEAVLTHYLAGLTEEQLQRLSQRFAVQKIPQLLRPEAIKRLHWHQSQGHQTIILSASPEAYLIPVAQTLGVNRVIGTRLEINCGVLTGKIVEKNCYGSEKVTQLQAVLGDLSQYCIYAYCDGRGDRELLDVANYSYYRTFHDSATVEPLGSTPNWERVLILSVVAAAALYLGMMLWSGAEQFWASLNTLPSWLIPALLALIFVGYCLRFVRWQWYLQLMGYQVPTGSSFRIFLASFALTASPGKAGEFIKSLLLKRHHDVPIAPTLAGLFCERFTDALSIMLLIGLSLFSVFQSKWAIVAVGLIQLAIVLVLQQPVLIKQRVLEPLARWSKLRAIIQKIEVLIDSASTLLKPKILVGSTLLALLAWGLEGIALYFIFQFLGIEIITPYQAVLIFTASGLIGALSLLPGGIGSTEVLTISFSIMYGATQTAAVTATFLIRLLTLWFAVGIGILAMLSTQNRV
ncbi:MAG: HAD-IB family hydrolase [Cyanobacteria bacterium QH_1_48_107]|nr:MAG: HAD-IB family hydrolase [Cyanobacteria bacterium QH_1_48_107]